MKRGIRIVGGFLLLLAGMAGWVLPIVPGWALFIPGLILLSREFRWAHRLLGWFRARFRKQVEPQHQDRPAE